jgi:hypothetical protein
MKRASRQRLLLLAVAAAIVAAAVWQWQRDAGREDDVLTTLDPATIHRIALSVAGTPTLHYEKRHGHWWHTDGTPVRADDSRLSDLADIAAAHVLQWRPATDFDAAKIGLSPPRAVLQLDAQTLAFGESSVTGPQRFVRVGQRVALVSARYVPRSPEIRTTEMQ